MLRKAKLWQKCFWFDKSAQHIQTDIPMVVWRSSFSSSIAWVFSEGRWQGLVGTTCHIWGEISSFTLAISLFTFCFSQIIDIVAFCIDLCYNYFFCSQKESFFLSKYSLGLTWPLWSLESHQQLLLQRQEHLFVSSFSALLRL